MLIETNIVFLYNTVMVLQNGFKVRCVVVVVLVVFVFLHTAFVKLFFHYLWEQTAFVQLVFLSIYFKSV